MKVKNLQIEAVANAFAACYEVENHKGLETTPELVRARSFETWLGRYQLGAIPRKSPSDRFELPFSDGTRIIVFRNANEGINLLWLNEVGATHFAYFLPGELDDQGMVAQMEKGRVNNWSTRNQIRKNCLLPCAQVALGVGL